MKTFIKVIEIWTPSQDRSLLNLSDSYYGDCTDFNAQSRDITFAWNEGLPGTAWAQSSPIIITDLDHSCFVRKDAARDAGISCAVALPIFAGQFLLAVVVLLCGDDEDIAGAIEIWGRKQKNAIEMSLINGYYGALEKFEWISRRISFPKGSGLPGTIWDYRIPRIVPDMSDSASFLRASNARIEGITTAFGIPFIYDRDHEFVLTFLSARGSPIARRFEIWLPDREHTFISLHNGHSEILHDVFEHRKISKGEGLIGRVWLTGCPAISHNPVQDNFISARVAAQKPAASVAIPIIEDGVLNSIVAFTL